MNKIKVHVTEPLRRSIRWVLEQHQVACDPPGATKWEATIESAEFTGRLEVYLDMAKLLDSYAQIAFQNRNRRFIRGPIEVRVVEMKEVEGTRKQEVR